MGGTIDLGETLPTVGRKRKSEKMNDLNGKQECEHEGCNKKPHFNFEHEDIGIFCKDHKSEGMVDCRFKNKSTSSTKVGGNRKSSAKAVEEDTDEAIDIDDDTADSRKKGKRTIKDARNNKPYSNDVEGVALIVGIDGERSVRSKR